MFHKFCTEMPLYLVFFFSGCAKDFVVVIFPMLFTGICSTKKCLLYFQSLHRESTLSTLALRIHATYGLALAHLGGSTLVQLEELSHQHFHTGVCPREYLVYLSLGIFSNLVRRTDTTPLPALCHFRTSNTSNSCK
jgi:hypothetical protein